MGLEAGLAGMPAAKSGLKTGHPLKGKLVRNEEGDIFKHDGSLSYYGQLKVIDPETLSPLERLIYDLD